MGFIGRFVVVGLQTVYPQIEVPNKTKTVQRSRMVQNMETPKSLNQHGPEAPANSPRWDFRAQMPNVEMILARDGRA